MQNFDGTAFPFPKSASPHSKTIPEVTRLLFHALSLRIVPEKAAGTKPRETKSRTHQ
jgi:hypothetical protein